MPQLTMLHNLIDKLKVISDTLYISTTRAGDLRFRVATDAVEFSSRSVERGCVASMSLAWLLMHGVGGYNSLLAVAASPTKRL